MGGSANHAAADAVYWSSQMVAVSARRDRASFMRIYDHFAPKLQRYLLGLGVNPSLAEELVQEALLKLWRKSSLFDPSRASLATWLFRVARNLYIDKVRREPRWSPMQDGLDQLDQLELHQRDSQPESFIQHDALQQAIDTLPALQAKLLRMNYLESHSHSEIAKSLDMPLGTVKSTLRRAFARLQESMRGTP